MKPIKSLWNNFKIQPDIWFFYGFLLTFTLSIRKVIKFYPIAGQFNEYAGIYLYLSDIFLIIVLISWGVSILQNKREFLSNIKHYFSLNKPFIAFFLFFNFWIFASVSWSDNHAIALFRAVKFLEFSLLSLYIILRIVPPQYKCSTWNILRDGRPPRVDSRRFGEAGESLRVEAGGTMQLPSPFLKGRVGEGFLGVRAYNGNAKIPPNPPFTKGENQDVPRGTSNTLSLFKREGWGGIFKIIIILGLFQAIIGIWQFFAQHSVGLFWLKESLLSPDLPGVAKIILNGEKYIRAYGLFPHPNILGAFLVFSILITWAYCRLIKIPFGPLASIRRSGPFTKGESQNVPRETSLGRWKIFGWVEDFWVGGTKQLPSPFSKGRGGEGFLYIFLSIQLIALVLTFSKSAIIGLIIAILYILWKIHEASNIPPQHKCSTWNILRGRRRIFYGEGAEHPTGQARNILRGKRGTINQVCHSEFISESNEIPGQARNDNNITVPRGTITRTLMFHVEHYWKEISIFVLILIIGFNYLSLDWNTFLLKSLGERKLYLDVSWETISNNPYLGVGIGQSVLEINNNVPRGTLLEPWQYQPVHNVFLLIWSELGLIGLILFGAFLYYVFHLTTKPALSSSNGEVEGNTPPHKNSQDINTVDKSSLNKYEQVNSNIPDESHWCGSRIYSVPYTLLKGFLFALLFIAFFDHYLWDIQQGQIILWLALGLFSGLAAFSKSTKTC